MTMYLGETVMVSVTSSEFLDATALLTDEDVAGVTVEIFNAALTEVASDDMTYDTNSDGDGYWYYFWDTSDSALAAGGYRARCTLTDTQGNVSIEWKRIRLARQPVQD